MNEKFMVVYRTSLRPHEQLTSFDDCFTLKINEQDDLSTPANRFTCESISGSIEIAVLRYRRQLHPFMKKRTKCIQEQLVTWS